jgi:hypothetical protein
MAATAEVMSQRRVVLAPAHRVGGVGGLVFVLTVVVQNGIRVSAPIGNASATDVVRYYATHRPATFVLAALFPLGAAGLAAFVGTMCSQLTAEPTRAPALAGMLGAAGIFATYTMLVATDLALADYVHDGGREAGVVSALWIVHNTVFGVLLVSIAVTLAGLTAAATAAGRVAPAWRSFGALGALALAVAGAATPALADGSRILVLGLAGFLTWVAFVAISAFTLVRRSAQGRTI